LPKKKQVRKAANIDKTSFKEHPVKDKTGRKRARSSDIVEHINSQDDEAKQCEEFDKLPNFVDDETKPSHIPDLVNHESKPSVPGNDKKIRYNYIYFQS
jgi:hypothetical protein